MDIPSLKILLTCQSMTFLSGSPIYNYTLAMELSKSHSVTLFSDFTDGLHDEGGDIMKQNLLNAGVRLIDCKDYFDVSEEFDVAFFQQKVRPDFKVKKAINIVHSEYDCEEPISEGIDAYVAIRPSIKEHLNTSHNIENDRIHVIYNGVDMNKFNPKNRTKHEGDYTKIVLPCTLDPLRERFLNYWIDRASEKERVFIYGLDCCGVTLHTNEYATIENATWDIQEKIKDADMVASILLGRVNLEARSMGIKSIIHNPENPKEQTEFYPSDEEFIREHDIKNVAIKLLNV